MGKIFKSCPECGAAYQSCHCEVVPKSALSKVVENYENDVQGAQSSYERNNVLKIMLKEVKKLLKG